MKKYHLKAAVFLSLVTLSGCATYLDFGPGLSLAKGTDCSGTNSKWETCYQRAAKDCPKGYKILQKRTYFRSAQGREDFLSGLLYEQVHGKDSIKNMTYQCNK